MRARVTDQEKELLKVRGPLKRREINDEPSMRTLEAHWTWHLLITGFRTPHKVLVACLKRVIWYVNRVFNHSYQQLPSESYNLRLPWYIGKGMILGCETEGFRFEGYSG